jgi:RNA polymerase sigma factor (sigma-70 family)
MHKPLRISDVNYAVGAGQVPPDMPANASSFSPLEDGNADKPALQIFPSKVYTVQHPSSDQAAFIQTLYIAHRQELGNYLISKFRIDPGEAEDVVQSAFMRLSELPNLGEIENHRAFLYKMCSNMVLDSQRHKKVTNSYANSMASDEEAYTNIGPEEEAESTQRLGLIARALWNMPNKRRQLLMMSRFDGLSYAEIARQVGLSETVVRKHIAKALADCHKALN